MLASGRCAESTAAEPLGADGAGAADSEPIAVVPAEESQKAEPISDDVHRLDDKQKGIEEGIEKEKEEKARRNEKESAEKTPSKLPVYLPAAASVILPVVVVALAVVHILSLSTAVYFIALGYVFLAVWLGRKTNTVYVVILGCVLAAVLTAVYCFWTELERYNFDIKAQEAKQRVTMTAPRDTLDIC